MVGVPSIQNFKHLNPNGQTTKDILANVPVLNVDGQSGNFFSFDILNLYLCAR